MSHDAKYYLERLRLLANAGISDSPVPNRGIVDLELPSIRQRIDSLLGIANNIMRPSTNMLFFVMYDIESNKTRRYVVKYLERMGCTRVQKSIFLADLSLDKYNQIRNDLTEVQAVYENNDSIFVVPLSTDLLKSMKIIGQNIDVDLITHAKNTLFF